MPERDGRLARMLVDEVSDAGRHEVTWDGGNNLGKAFASGIYFYRFEAGPYERTKKIVLLR